MYIKTGFGYYKKDGQIVMKFELPTGQHSDSVGYEVVEVANKEELDAIQIYQPPVVKTDDEKINDLVNTKLKEMAVVELKKDGLLLPDGKINL